MSAGNPAMARPSRPKVYLRLGRVSNLPTVWTNCLAGVFLGGGLTDPATLLPLFVALSLFYTGGMFLNDAFDHTYDAEFRPERPIPAGQIALREVYAAGFVQLALGLALLGVPGLLQEKTPEPLALLGGLALGLLIVYYNYRHKTDPMSPFIMAFCRAMVYFIAAAAVANALAPAVMWSILVVVGYLVGLTYIAKQENLAEVGNLWPLLFLAVPFAYGFPLVLNFEWQSLFYLFFLAWVLYSLFFLLRTRNHNIPRAVISLIAGISLLDGLLIMRVGPLEPWALATLPAFALTLALQKLVPGT